MNLFEIIGYPLVVVSALELILGFILLWNNPRNSPVNRSVAVFSFFTAAFSLITALMYILASFGTDITLLARANWIGWLMIPAAMQFVYYLKDEQSRPARMAGYVLYPFWIIVLFVSVSTNLIESGTYSLIPYTDHSGPLAKPLRAIGIIQMAWVMYELFRYRRSASGLMRARLNYFTHGITIFAAGGMLIAGILPLVSGSSFEPGLGSYFGFPWVALTYYAISRHRLFDVRIVASRTLTIVLLSLLFSAMHLGLFTLLRQAIGNALAILASLAIIGFLFFGTKLSRKVQHWTKRIILRRTDEYHTVLKESIKAIATKLDLDELLNFITDSMRKSLEVESVCLFLQAAGGRFALRKGVDVHERITSAGFLDSAIIRWMQGSGKMVIREELEAISHDEASGLVIASLREINVAAVIPLFSKDQMLGVLTLGRKKNREPYTVLDIDLLEALAIQAAVGIENALLYDKMEEKVRERTRELEEAKKIAEDANKAKSEFLSNISHELRTPLNSIIGFSDVMRNGTAGPLTPDQEAYLKDIWESGKHLLRIINDILDLSKIEAGMMLLEYDDFYLKELLVGSLSLFREKAQRQNIALSAEISDEVDMITADKTKIKQVALNLLANAVKFTPEGGSVSLSARRVRSSELGVRSQKNGSPVSELETPNSGLDADFIEICVADTGIGMTPEDCARLFRPFLQLDNSTTRKYEGTGLGLHLSKKIVELHQGRIWVESEPGRGSRFSFTIPLPAAEAQAGQDPPVQ